MNTIYILWLRQLKKYFRSKSRMIGSLGQPILFLVSFGFGFNTIFQKAGEGNYIQFLAPGIILMSIVFVAVFSGIDIIWDRQFGFLKETLVAPVSRVEIIMGKTLGGATIAMIQGFIVFILTLFVGFRPVSGISIVSGLLITALVSTLFTLLGVAIASGLEDMQGFQLIMNFLVMPTVFLSGAFFPLEDIPHSLLFITKIDPLSYGVDALRDVLVGITNFGIVTDVIVLSTITLFLLGLGNYLFSKIQI